MRIAPLVSFAVVLASATVAHADPPADGTPYTAFAGTDPDAVFDHIADDYYTALSDGTPCADQHGCHSKVTGTAKLGKHGVVQLRHGENTTFGSVDALVVGDGDGHWYGAAVSLDVFVGDCGMMQCFDSTYGKITVEQTKYLVWISVRVNTRYTLSVDRPSKHKRWHSDLIVGCKPGTTTQCAVVHAGSSHDRGSGTIHGNTVHVKEGGSPAQDVTITF